MVEGRAGTGNPFLRWSSPFAAGGLELYAQRREDSRADFSARISYDSVS